MTHVHDLRDAMRVDPFPGARIDVATVVRRGRRRRLRTRVGGAMTALLLVGSAVGVAGAVSRDPDITVAGAPADAARGEVVPVFSADDVPGDVSYFVVYAAVQRSDGAIVVSYDRSAEQAGDDRGGPAPDPHLTISGSAGRWLPVTPPDVDAEPVPGSARPLAAADDGGLYLWDPDHYRVVAWEPDGTWRAVAALPRWFLANERAPQGAVGPDGSLYVTGAASLFRIDPIGTVTQIAGTDQVNTAGWPPPEPGERRDAGGTLPLLGGVVVDDTGTVYLTTTGTVVLAVHPDGSLTSFGNPTALSTPDGHPLPGNTTDGPTRLTDLALDAEGSLLAADIVHRQILRITADQTTVIADNVNRLFNGTRTGRTTTHDLLVEADNDGGLSLYGDPANK